MGQFPTADDNVDDHLPKKSNEKMRVADEKRMLAEIGKHLGAHTKVADVHDGDVEAMHRRISESIGPGGKPRRVRANRILTVCSKMFSLSLRSRDGENAPWRNAVLGNPCKGIERNHEEGRERFFSQAELAANGTYHGSDNRCNRSPKGRSGVAAGMLPWLKVAADVVREAVVRHAMTTA